MALTRYLPIPVMDTLRSFLKASPSTAGPLMWIPRDSDTTYIATRLYGVITVAMRTPDGVRNAQIDCWGTMFGDEEVVQDVLETFLCTPIKV